MRPFEIILGFLLLAGPLSAFIFGRRASGLFPVCYGLALAALAAHLAFEGPHWQMAGSYLALFVSAPLLIQHFKSGRLRISAGAGTLFLVFLSCLASILLPMFKLPAPTGGYPVGTRVMYLADPSREENVGGDHLKQELMVQIWYPAGPSKNPLAPYRRRLETTLLSSYQAVLPTNSRLNAPVAVAGAPYCILLFNPAWNGRRTQDTFLTEDLASHGFVVVAIDHTWNSGPVAFPDGRVVSPLGAMKMENLSHLDPQRLYEAITQEVRKQAVDNVFVLDQLRSLDETPDSPFFRRLDTSRTGAFGHSVGGSVAALVCYRDPRVRAVLDMGGPLFGEVSRQGLDKPFMVIYEDLASDGEDGTVTTQPSRVLVGDPLDQIWYEHLVETLQINGGYDLVFGGINHASFTDHILFSPISRLSGRGRVPAARVHSILRQYALAFFEQSLQGKKPEILLSGPSPFHEVAFTHYQPRLIDTDADPFSEQRAAPGDRDRSASR